MKGSVTEAERERVVGRDGGKSRGDGVGTCNVKGKERETAREKQGERLGEVLWQYGFFSSTGKRLDLCLVFSEHTVG